MSAVDAPALTISTRLADYVGSLRWVDLPQPVVDRTKELIVHHLGLALDNSGSQAMRGAVELAHELSGADGACTIVGERRRADLLEAIFANSLLIGHDGRDDVILPPGVHPGIVVLPVAWAVGETTGASGQELITAIVAGYEVMTRLCGSVWSWGSHVPRRPNNVVATFGAAAAAARLMGLSQEQTVHAFGHAGQLAVGITEGTDHVPITHALLARNGATAAVLASLGVPAAPTIVEGANGVFRSFFFADAPDDLLTGLGSPSGEYAVQRAGTKLRKASELNMVPLALTQQLIDDPDLHRAAIAEVHVALPIERKPREDVWEADLAAARVGGQGNPAGSLRFRIANALLDGDVDAVRRERKPDEDLLDILDRIQVSYEDGRPIRYARITVVTDDGRTRVTEGDSHTVEMPSWPDWLAHTGGAVLPERQLERLAELLSNLEAVTAGELMAALVPPGNEPRP